jgi:hypothetical protein
LSLNRPRGGRGDRTSAARSPRSSNRRTRGPLDTCSSGYRSCTSWRAQARWPDNGRRRLAPGIASVRRRSGTPASTCPSRRTVRLHGRTWRTAAGLRRGRRRPRRPARCIATLRHGNDTPYSRPSTGWSTNNRREARRLPRSDRALRRRAVAASLRPRADRCVRALRALEAARPPGVPIVEPHRPRARGLRPRRPRVQRSARAAAHASWMLRVASASRAGPAGC